MQQKAQRNVVKAARTLQRSNRLRSRDVNEGMPVFSGDQPIPDAVRKEIERARLPANAARRVLEAFGPIPPAGALELINRLIAARGAYEVQNMAKPPKSLRHRIPSFPTHSQELHRLSDMHKSATRLLKLLGIDNPNDAAVEPFERRLEIFQSPGVPGLLPLMMSVAKERRGDKAVLDAIERLASLLLLLSDLVEASERAAKQIKLWMGKDGAGKSHTGESTPAKKGLSRRGGRRTEGESASSTLIASLIDTYHLSRKRYPKSGPPFSFDKALRDFVRAGLEFATAKKPPVRDSKGNLYVPLDELFADPAVLKRSDDAIRGIFNRHKHKPV